MLGHRVQSLWLLTHTRVRQPFCVINNSLGLEKQHDQNHNDQGVGVGMCTATPSYREPRTRYTGDCTVLFFVIHVTSKQGVWQPAVFRGTRRHKDSYG